jgi:hypothetical protein
MMNLINEVLSEVLPTLFKKSGCKEGKIYFPNISFNLNGKIITERIINYYTDDEEFYVKTDQGKLLYINDEILENQIIYGEPEDLIDVSENKIIWED